MRTRRTRRDHGHSSRAVWGRWKIRRAGRLGLASSMRFDVRVAVYAEPADGV
jgi:hypothetical protein